MRAELLMWRRVVLEVDAFAEIVFWKLPAPRHSPGPVYKFRLAYVVDGKCVLRYDNERGKGAHRHCDGVETSYAFDTPERLVAGFLADIRRWNDEHGRT
jgi:hypothetical protein